jgi:hypothetical protein
VAPWITTVFQGAPDSPQPSSLTLSADTLRVVGLDFAPADLDAFAAIRMSKEITKYAELFRSALQAAHTSTKPENELLRIMAEAMDSAEVAQKAAGALETIGSIVNVVGLVPVVGTIASAVGMPPTLPSALQRRSPERADGTRWEQKCKKWL